MEHSNVFAIYDRQQKKVVQVVCDGNINDAWHDYPDCIKVPIDAVVLGQLELTENTANFIQSCCEEVEAAMQP